MPNESAILQNDELAEQVMAAPYETSKTGKDSDLEEMLNFEMEERFGQNFNNIDEMQQLRNQGKSKTIKFKPGAKKNLNLVLEDVDAGFEEQKTPESPEISKEVFFKTERKMD